MTLADTNVLLDVLLEGLIPTFLTRDRGFYRDYFAKLRLAD